MALLLGLPALVKLPFLLTGDLFDKIEFLLDATTEEGRLPPREDLLCSGNLVRSTVTPLGFNALPIAEAAAMALELVGCSGPRDTLCLENILCAIYVFSSTQSMKQRSLTSFKSLIEVISGLSLLYGLVVVPL